MEEADKGWLMIRIGGVGECFFWYQLTQVVPDKGPKNGCCCAHVHVTSSFVTDSGMLAEINNHLTHMVLNVINTEEYDCKQNVHQAGGQSLLYDLSLLDCNSDEVTSWVLSQIIHSSNSRFPQHDASHIDDDDDYYHNQ